MSKSYFKIYFSKIKETKWLNQLGQSGLLLEKISDSKYIFSENKNKKYYYSIEYFDCNPESEDAVSVFREYKEKGIFPIVTSGNWVYLVSETSAIAQSKLVSKKNSIPYFWRAFYTLFFAICGAVVCGYQFFAVSFLDKISHLSDGVLNHLNFESSGTAFDKILALVVKPVNLFIDLLNNSYLSFITKIFGENDAIVVIALLLPIVIALTALGAYNLSEYFMYYKKFHKKLRMKN